MITFMSIFYLLLGEDDCSLGTLLKKKEGKKNLGGLMKRGKNKTINNVCIRVFC